MVPEPSVPFYYVLSVYIPLLLVAYLGVYLTLTVVVGCIKQAAAILLRIRWTGRKGQMDRVALGTVAKG